MDTSTSTPLWPLLVYFAAVLLVVGSMIVGSWLLGPRHREPATGEPYESGIRSTGSARLRFAARFYLVAMFFLIFDLEAIFLFAWAVAARELGWAGYLEVVVFIAILLVALIYVWRLGALDVGPASPVGAKRSLKRSSADAGTSEMAKSRVAQGSGTIT